MTRFRAIWACLGVLGAFQATAALADGRIEPRDSAWLVKQSKQLLAAEAGRRAEVVHTLSHLDVDTRDAIVARIGQLAPDRPPTAEVLRVLETLRGEPGSDPLAGVPDLLARERTPVVRAVVEPLLYLRSLETMAGAEGQLALAAFLELDAGAWEQEVERARKRLGAQLVPALLAMRAHDSARVRRFAQLQLSALGLEDPNLVLSHGDPHLVARALLAYANPLDFAAMPRIARMLGDRRIQVREAARAAIARFGKNAIWQLREAYLEASGQAADKRWDHERAARELYAVLDRPGLEEAQTSFARGQRAFAAGDLATMQREYDALLAKHPSFEQRAQLAPGYARLAASLFQANSLEAALAAYRRALRLAPDAPEAVRWQAHVAFVSAELSLTRGVVDLTGYRRALTLDPELHAARDALDRLSGTRTQRARDMKRYAALAALALLSILAALRVRRTLATPDNLFCVRIAPGAESGDKEEPHAQT